MLLPPLALLASCSERLSRPLSCTAPHAPQAAARVAEAGANPHRSELVQGLRVSRGSFFLAEAGEPWWGCLPWNTPAASPRSSPPPAVGMETRGRASGPTRGNAGGLGGASAGAGGGWQGRPAHDRVLFPHTLAAGSGHARAQGNGLQVRRGPKGSPFSGSRAGWQSGGGARWAFAAGIERRMGIVVAPAATRGFQVHDGPRIGSAAALQSHVPAGQAASAHAGPTPNLPAPPPPTPLETPTPHPDAGTHNPLRAKPRHTPQHKVGGDVLSSAHVPEPCRVGAERPRRKQRVPLPRQPPRLQVVGPRRGGRVRLPCPATRRRGPGTGDPGPRRLHAPITPIPALVPGTMAWSDLPRPTPTSTPPSWTSRTS